MAEQEQHGTIKDLEDRLRKVIAMTARAYAAVLVMFAFMWIFLEAQASVELTVGFTPTGQFALISVVVAVVIGMLVLGRTVAEIGRDDRIEDQSVALIAALLPFVGFGSCMVAAAVGWAALLPPAPDRISIQGIVWFFVSIGLALIASVVVELVPRWVVRDLAAERRRRRREWVDRARGYWSRKSTTVGTRAFDVAALMAFVAVAVAAAVVTYPQGSASAVLQIVAVLAAWLASAVAVIITYVLRQWWALTAMVVMSMTSSLALLIVALTGASTAGHPIAIAALWFLAGLFATVGVAHSFKRGFLRALVSRLLQRARTTIDRADNPECRCNETPQPRLACLRKKHAMLTGREWPPAIRCPAHPDRGRFGGSADPASDALAA